MTNHALIDLDYTKPPTTLCGHSLIGPDTGTCPCCKKYKQIMFNGQCTSCNTQKGLNPLGYCPRADDKTEEE